MRTLMLFLMLTAFGLGAQTTNTPQPNVVVNFNADNQPYFGLTNYPTGWQFAINSSPVSGWSTNMLYSDYQSYFNSLQISYRSGASNANYSITNGLFLTKSNFNYLMVNIPLGLIDTSNRMAFWTNLYSSFKSGTNNSTLAIVNSNLTTVAQQNYYTWVYMNQIISALSRLIPPLQSIYNPATDPVGH